MSSSGSGGAGAVVPTGGGGSSSSLLDDFFRDHLEARGGGAGVVPPGDADEGGAADIAAAAVTKMTWAEWRSFRREMLQEFLQARILGSAEEEDEEEDDAEEYSGAAGTANARASLSTRTGRAEERTEQHEEEEEEDEPESQALETQQQSLPFASSSPLFRSPARQRPEHGLAGATDSVRRRQRQRRLSSCSEANATVPYYFVGNARQRVSYVSDIDLATTARLSLKLCLVEKRWAVRGTSLLSSRAANAASAATTTNRPIGHKLLVCKSEAPAVLLFGEEEATAPSTNSNDNTATADSATLLPRLLRWTSVDDDGPLGTCYRHVLALQLAQVDAPTELRARSENIQQHQVGSTAGTKKRIRVFLYNQYAKVFSKLLQLYQQEPGRMRKRVPAHEQEILVALSDVPARCIFPYAPVDWYERQHFSQYCVCIGDESAAKMAEPGSPAKNDGGDGDDDSDAGVKAERFDDSEMKLFVGWKADDGRVNGANERLLRVFSLQRDGYGKVEINEIAGERGSNASSNSMEAEYQRWKGPLSSSPSVAATAVGAVPSRQGQEQPESAVPSKRLRMDKSDGGDQTGSPDENATPNSHVAGSQSDGGDGGAAGSSTPQRGQPKHDQNGYKRASPYSPRKVRVPYDKLVR